MCVWLLLGVLAGVTVRTDLVRNPYSQCTDRLFTLNVVLLNDSESPWTLSQISPAVTFSLNHVNSSLQQQGFEVSVNASFYGFDNSLYLSKGCPTSTCEGVEILKNLFIEEQLGCVVLGPTCTYATFQVVSLDTFLEIPIISAGSFGLSCDFKPNVTRILPPARKLSNFFISFWKLNNSVKHWVWKTTYIYKKDQTSESCFWYMNALEAGSAHFSLSFETTIIRTPDKFRELLCDPNRESNVFIVCGTPNDVDFLIQGFPVDKDIVIILLDIFNHTYSPSAGSMELMKQVVVVTWMPPGFNHESHQAPNISEPYNDFSVGYSDAVLLFGKVLEKFLQREETPTRSDFIKHFRNITFGGSLGPIHLDEHGDRDINVTLFYTSTQTLEYKVLLYFNTKTNNTIVIDSNPEFVWKQSLPTDQPTFKKGLPTQTVAVIALAVTVVLAFCIALVILR